MKASVAEPPRRLAEILRLVLPADLAGRSIRGDLEQEYRLRAAGSVKAARRWYRREALSVIWHRLLVLLLPGRRNRRSGIPGQSCPQEKGDPMLQVLGWNLRHAVRSLARTPRFTAVAAVTLALGIGATTAVFSTVNGVLLQSLPYPDSERIVGLWHGAPDLGYEQFGISPGIFYHYSVNNQIYEAMGLYAGLQQNVTGDGYAERVAATGVTAGFFDVLGVPPFLGRTFSAEETTEGGPGLVILSYGLWKSRYGGDRDILGQSLTLNGNPTEIVGVMPAGFTFGGPNQATEIWLPMHVDLESGDPGTFAFSGIARLKPDVTPEAAVAGEEILLQGVRERWADSETFIGFLDASGFHPIVHTLQEEIVGEIQQPLWILLGTVGFVLLIACANVANLFLVRAESRQREIAVRAALGAGRKRLNAEFLTESIVLAGLGGLLGLILAWVGTPLLLQMAPPKLPRIEQIGMDGYVLGFALGVTLLTAILFGLVPAFRHRMAGLLGTLGSGGRGLTAGRERHRLRNTLVVFQTALALVLLVGSGLLVKSFAELRRIDPGFTTDNLLTFRISVPFGDYPGSTGAASFHARLLERLQALPGVEAAGGISTLPLVGGFAGTAYDIEDSPTPAGELPPMFYYKYASPGYFEAMGISIMEGRAFELADMERATGNVIVSQAIADRLWPGESALGRRIRSNGDTTAAGWQRIVGVVEDTRDLGLRQDPVQVIYHPLVGPHADNGYAVRDLSYAIATSNPLGLVDPVRDLVRELDPDLPLAAIQTMESIMADSIRQLTFTTLALGVAAVMALILGAVGLYGVLSYIVSQRTREIGVRLALGAQTAKVLGMVMLSGAKLALLGLGLGLAGAWALTRLLQGLLFGTEPIDPVTFAGMALVLLVVSLVASWFPARRAAGVDPVESMRLE